MRTAVALGLAAISACAVLPARAADGKLAVVAAENFYGDIARQVGGERVTVTSIIYSPDQDPHLFEITPGVVRQIANAQVVIFNGAGYDPWMDKLLQAAPRPGRLVINMAALTRRKVGDNPHLWYDPATMRTIARALNADFTKIDRAHARDYDARLAAFEFSLKAIDDKIAAIRAKSAGAPVTASEPVVGYMAAALGFTMRNERFQLAIMNDTEPSARDMAAIEQDLKTRKVKIMFYNKQAANKVVQHLIEIARAAHVPLVGVTETAPPGLSFQDWMLMQLNDIDKALAERNS